ncbi:MAG: nucleoside deaminase [Bacteroidales bacterium]|nr:nucleoside deaminase [Bacteroidales bacterium]
MDKNHEYMQMAIAEAREGIRQGHGGPFGCVIVKDGEVLAKAHNRVLQNHDATAHGEIMAIREAGEVLGTHDLEGCTLYTTGEPCHMCLCAILWANISKVYYGCTITDNARIGFRDEHFDDLFGGREKLGDLLTEIDRDECLRLFDEYNKMTHKDY